MWIVGLLLHAKLGCDRYVQSGYRNPPNFKNSSSQRYELIDSFRPTAAVVYTDKAEM